jgi:single-strand DNA-binding protein
MNNVNLIGRLVKEPEIKTSDDGTKIAKRLLAIGDVFSKEDRTDLIYIDIDGHQAELCERYLHRGFLIGVSGRIRADRYTDANGKVHSSAVVTADRVQYLQWPDMGQERESKPADYSPVNRPIVKETENSSDYDREIDR